MDPQALSSIMQLTAQTIPAVQGYFQSREAKDLADVEEGKRLGLETDVQNLMNNRVKLRNPYANLSVATEAAEFEAQQVDASLANTLDAMRAGGFGASGATALARKAAQAKQGIGADIQKQEQANQVKFAEGEAALQKAIDDRQTGDINFKISQLNNARQNEQDLRDEQRLARQQGVYSSATGIANSLSQNPDMLSALFGGNNGNNLGGSRGIGSGFDSSQLYNNRDKAYSDLMKADLNQMIEDDLGDLYLEEDEVPTDF
jgi:hypothetical protein